MSGTLFLHHASLGVQSPSWPLLGCCSPVTCVLKQFRFTAPFQCEQGLQSGERCEWRFPAHLPAWPLLFFAGFVKQHVPGFLLSSCFAAFARRDPCQDGELGWRRQPKGLACKVSAAFLFCPDARNCCPGRVWQCPGMWQGLLLFALCWWPRGQHGPVPHRDAP